MSKHSEAVSIADEYKHALRDLTFNSKPIINNLTLFAQEHLAFSTPISKVLIDHFISVHPDIKLPALYLIDSICKNIGEPYISNFITLLPGAFPVAYRQLRDERSRRDFGRTLETWWNIFPSDMIQDLQNKAAEEESKRHTLPLDVAALPSVMKRHIPPPIDASSLPPVAKRHISPIDAILPPVSRRPPPPPQHIQAPPSVMQYSQPPPPTPRFTYPRYQYPIPPQIVMLLQDLRSSMAVPAEMYNEQRVADIMYHLEYACSNFDPGLFMAADERARLIDKRPLIDFIDSIVGMNNSSVSNTNGHNIKIKSPALAPSQLHRHDRLTLSKQAPPSSSSSLPPKQPQRQMQTHIPPSSIQPTTVMTNLPDVSPLLASLTSAFPLDLSSLISANNANPSAPLIRPIYEEIIKNHPTAYRSIYSDLPKQCTNCALRFPDTPEGQSQLESHLDDHFRRNIRSKDKAKKVLARLWSPTEQDWIKNVEVKEFEHPAALFGLERETTPKETPKLASKIPAGSDLTEKFCLTCNEKIDVCWDDETDEWIFKDATEDANGHLVHISCVNKL